MKTVCILLLLSLSLQAQEWTPLYNGENLDGWEHVGPGNFIIEDGILKSQGGMGLLWFTGQKFSNVTAGLRKSRQAHPTYLPSSFHVVLTHLAIFVTG